MDNLDDQSAEPVQAAAHRLSDRIGHRLPEKGARFASLGLIMAALGLLMLAAEARLSGRAQAGATPDVPAAFVTLLRGL